MRSGPRPRKGGGRGGKEGGCSGGEGEEESGAGKEDAGREGGSSGGEGGSSGGEGQALSDPQENKEQPLRVHGRRRYFCKECGGAGICEHGLRRSNCKDCGGHGGGKQRLRSRLQLHWPSVQSEFIECTAEPEPRDLVSTFNRAVLNKKRWARPLGGLSFCKMSPIYIYIFVGRSTPN